MDEHKVIEILSQTYSRISMNSCTSRDMISSLSHSTIPTSKTISIHLVVTNSKTQVGLQSADPGTLCRIGKLPKYTKSMILTFFDDFQKIKENTQNDTFRRISETPRKCSDGDPSKKSKILQNNSKMGFQVSN